LGNCALGKETILWLRCWETFRKTEEVESGSGEAGLAETLQSWKRNETEKKRGVQREKVEKMGDKKIWWAEAWVYSKPPRASCREIRTEGIDREGEEKTRPCPQKGLSFVKTLKHIGFEGD